MKDYEKQAEATIYKIELLPTKAEKLKAYKNELVHLYRKIDELNDFTNSQVAKLLKENEDLLIREYSNRCEQRRIIHKNLIDSFSEQLGILDKEDDVLFSLKAIKAIISNILEIEK